MKVIAGVLFVVFLALGFTFMVWGMNETMGLNSGPALIGAACFFAIIARIAQAHLLHNGSINQPNTLPIKAETGRETPEHQPTEERVASSTKCKDCQEFIPIDDFNNSGAATCPYCGSLNEPHDNTFKVLIWGTIIFAVGFLLLFIVMKVINE